MGSGVVVTDLSLTPIAADRGAADILHGASPDDLDGNGSTSNGVQLPREVLEFVHNHQPDGGGAPGETTFRSNGAQYTCRVFQIEPQNSSLPKPVLVLHFEKGAAAPTDAVYQVAADYGLTDREQEALVGISLGLTSKELAKRMSISPNTVRAFLRLIMIKMDVSTRGGIVAKILDRAQAREAS
jgi:DNA-binding CsgD family transcriptional regulator